MSIAMPKYRLNEYVLVNDYQSELYRRRCKITACQETAAGYTYTVYSEGLDESGEFPADQLQPSTY